MMHRFFSMPIKTSWTLASSFHSMFTPATSTLPTLISTTRQYTTYNFASVMQTFSSTPALHFTSQYAFHESELYKRLQYIFSNAYSLDGSELKTVSLQKTLSLLGLDVFYKKYSDTNKYLIGTHGTSKDLLHAIVPELHGIKPMGTAHNPFHSSSGPVLFFYGSNVNMILHYSHINSVMTEHVTGSSDPHYFPDRIGVLGFADQAIIDKINARKIPVENTQASIKKSHDKSPEDYVIGKEVRLPKTYHAAMLNLPIFSIRGTKRLLPLDNGKQYADGKECAWIKGKGYVHSETDEAINRVCNKK
jgi:hypothetical protein